jgi:STAM-binding protein
VGLYNNHPPQPSVPISAYEQQTQRRPSPIPPAPVPAPPITSAVDQTRITPASSGDVVPRELKTVYLPRESLPRFLNVAAVNTARNRETCGLLLGKDKKSKFVVTTLLIPKQHSTSDTCTMDEEELVMSFTEERSLITLGWVSIIFVFLLEPTSDLAFSSQIHTHPTQSCFMSSVDLHTHSGFQRMLPESFAVVCAPTSTPK